MKQSFQWPFGALDEKQMHVIRHHDPRDLRAALAIEVLQRVTDNLRAVCVPQNA